MCSPHSSPRVAMNAAGSRALQGVGNGCCVGVLVAVGHCAPPPALAGCRRRAVAVKRPING
jgi:hypothetical protein